MLVLEATGAVGRITVQAARLLGAAHVIAAGRKPEGIERAPELGADHAIRILEDEKLSAPELREVSGGRVDVVGGSALGPSAAPELEAAGTGGRLVQIDLAAGSDSRLAAGTIRRRAIDIRG